MCRSPPGPRCTWPGPQSSATGLTSQARALRGCISQPDRRPTRCTARYSRDHHTHPARPVACRSQVDSATAWRGGMAWARPGRAPETRPRPRGVAPPRDAAPPLSFWSRPRNLSLLLPTTTGLPLLRPMKDHRMQMCVSWFIPPNLKLEGNL